MADAGDVKERCPQVFVVDSLASGGPTSRHVPRKPDAHRLSLLHLLLGVALLGVFIEAGFTLHLYSRLTVPSDSQKVEYIKAEKDSSVSEAHDYNEILPGKYPPAEIKPAAFLQKGKGGLIWASNIFPTFVNGMKLKNNSLYIEQEGYYYIFSKISYPANCSFIKHQVMCNTERYSNRPMELMKANVGCYCHKGQLTSERGNSYLGGIFHLLKEDIVFVEVNDHSHVLGEASENFFGAFKIH